MTHNMKLDPVPFAKIKNSSKTIELRLFDEKRRKISSGDKIIFTNTNTGEQICKTVLRLHRFDSFDMLYKNLPLLKCGYTRDNIDKATPDDMLKYYSLEEEKKYGVVGIELCL